MKKLMFAAAVAAGLAAFGEGIESANTVGYTTKTIGAGKYMMIAVQFDTTAGAALSADDAFTLDQAPASWVDPENDDDCIPGWYENAPCLKIPQGTVDKGYTDLYYSSNACYEDATGYHGKKGWADQLGMLVQAPQLKPGYGVWIKAGNADLVVTISGQVKATASDSFSGGVGYNLLRLPYPVTINAADSKIDWGLSGQAAAAWNDPENDDDCISGWYENAPCLKIPQGTVEKGYTDLYYSSNACYEDATGYHGKPGWADQLGMLVTNASIPEGQGFWLVLKQAATITQTK